MKRRQFLKASSRLSAYLIVGRSLAAGISAVKAEAQTGLPIQSLQALLDPKKDLILLPQSVGYSAHNISFNKRTMLSPKIRVVVSSQSAAQAAIAWAEQQAQANPDFTFAIRSGGHSYEGYSQSKSMVIDVRGCSAVVPNVAGQTVTVGAGADLGSVYETLGPHNLAIPAGSCFHVGVAGHALGGGFGLLGRALGLACDSILSMQMIDAKGTALTLSATENQDLFWACRGAGNGNFGLVTEFVFQTHTVGNVCDFDLTWDVPLQAGIQVVNAWQGWLATLPDEVTCILNISKASNGELSIRCAGQALTSETQVTSELSRLQRAAGHNGSVRLSTRSFLASTKYFDGHDPGYESIYMKAKSDYVTQPMSVAGIKTLLEGLLSLTPGKIAVICDSYGGAINRIDPQATAFFHRGTTMYSMQYYMQWDNAAETNANLSVMQKLYAAMRPYVSGGAYVNYCDLDLGERGGAEAYWGGNLDRLITLKNQYDPTNVFQHQQGVPLK